MERIPNLLHRPTLAVLLLLLLALLLSSSSTVAARATVTTTTTESSGNGSGGYFRSRKLLVTAPRVSPGSQQQMDASLWRWTTPFRGARASLGRRVPGSHGNPSHN
ncbi:hypothetical protein BDA96_06G131500 [Sorghum bicolor]|jgi:hypothetical protein|uniref:Uncharacterized protein n=2 Tax=Sorghum bicolor TaxID=4558 RepID=A0A921UC65_SORBI|nr:hypothetical protein BDA96_06G131500 [Sorghum bicolor]OQU81790.1 hypothetical protein SORBI_3006G118850 [Sorghum bicolor]